MKQMLLLCVAACAATLVFGGCGDAPPSTPTINPGTDPLKPADGFALSTRNAAIRSYPGGGGLFIVTLQTDGTGDDSVRLRLIAHPALHAVLTPSTLSRHSTVAEVVIHTDTALPPGDYDIAVIGSSRAGSSELHLNVTVMEWRQYEPAEEIAKREEFLPWLHATHPELGDFPDQVWTRFMTYPQVVIVEHWTFLNSAWEMRVCFHVMVPPDDWSMLLLRRRGEVTPRFAARRESDGSIHEIPLSEYPTMFGY